ncbi:MAG: alanine--tRNA ligase-related protein [Candidatus Dojkabacteria bacterium]
MAYTSKQIRQKFLEFYKTRGHKEVANVSLVPNVDSSLLFVNSGMFPIAPYLAGQKHPMGKRLVNSQRCLRTKYDEMLEIGDNRHTLMFEMLGNWSLGDFFKKEQIPWCLKLHVEEYGLDPSRLYVSVWGGDDLVPRDDEAIELWKQAFKEYDIEAEFSEDLSDIPANLEEGKSHKTRIFPYGKSDNWWQRGEAAGELGGPSSEIFYDLGEIDQEEEGYHINDDSGRFIEIGNNVFMEYFLDEKLNWQPLEQKNIDFGGGFERVVMCVQGKKDIFETDIYQPILDAISDISGKSYKGNERDFRVLADHSRAATFILGDGVIPSNKDQGYILRRFIRRLVRFGLNLEIDSNFSARLADAVVEHYSDYYSHLAENKEQILKEIEKEETKFRQTLRRGLKELNKMRAQGEEINGTKAFYIYETYGFPFEMTMDELEVDEDKYDQFAQQFEMATEEHRKQSRSGAEQKFKGGLADSAKETIALHTAHHLLLAALQQVLGKHVKQKGSNITGERLRIDVSHPEKITEEERASVEKIVNNWIDSGFEVAKLNLPKTKAESLGAEMEFGQKYGERVSVYAMGQLSTELLELAGQGEIGEKELEQLDKAIAKSEIFSLEFCGGPHVPSGKELAEIGKFRISKEQSSGAGIRRIKAVLA